MKIKKILTQYRRDFTAIMECEHCGFETTLTTGYDDERYHTHVIPHMHCPECKKQAADDYRPLTTKYPEGYQI
jgi:predicted Zn-ribbon and HTH transcriptional regulator